MLPLQAELLQENAYCMEYLKMEINALSVDVTTGEQIITPLDETQAKLREEMLTLSALQDAEFLTKKEQEKELLAKKAAAEAKLAALGLDADDLKALGL